jgi:hypothetical protein
VKAEDGEKILRNLLARNLLNALQLEFILDAAARLAPGQAHKRVLNWARVRGYVTHGNVTQSAPARAARALARVRLKKKEKFEKVRAYWCALLNTARPPP